MNSQIADEIVEELASTFQKLETQSAALLEFVKDKGIVKEDDLAPYMERAGAASAVRWRATRVRMARLLASAESGDGHAKESGKAEEQERSKSKQGDEHSQDKDKEPIKQAESLASGPVEAQAEDDRAKRKDDRAKQKKDRSEKPVQKSSNAREDQEKPKVESAGQQQPPKEHSEKRTGAGDQNSATKQDQSSATSSRSDNDKDRQKTDRENEDRKNVA
jgi:hypothetical protein